MITDFSESGGYFQSDNFLSNESGYQNVIPALLKTLKTGGVYIGVGPEQNFTYIVALQPKIAFIIDIRRQNMLEHLFYKALMETSSDRAEFLSRLFARPGVDSTTNSTPETLFHAYKLSRPIPAFFEANIRRVVEYLEHQKGFKLSEQDEAGIRHVVQAFFLSGPELSYTFIGGYGNFRRMPSYSDLMTESDGVSRNWNFLATEDQFQAIQRMQKSNLIVPANGVLILAAYRLNCLSFDTSIRRQFDVRWLQIPMNKTGLVRRLQCFRDLLRDRQRFIDRNRATF
jgi:hypothetical protein